MSTLVDMVLRVLADAGMQTCADHDEVRLSMEFIVSRVKKEGDEFLTITLPSFAKEFERSLANERLTETSFQHWKKDSAGRPKFLGFLLSRVFDESGCLLSNVNPDIVFFVRQITLMCKKTHDIASETRQRAALGNYVDVENDIDLTWRHDGFDAVARVIMSDILAKDPQGFNAHSVRPKHGPGATAEGYTANNRWSFRVWHERLEKVFPYSHFCLANENFVNEIEESQIDFRDESSEQPVKVVLVPKTAKTPRVIAIEPSCMQYAQQGLMEYLVGLIERSNYTSGHVNFGDQTVNQRLALASSANGAFATLDMKEASDRVSYAHAKALLSVSPDLWSAVDACRSRMAILPDGVVVPLKKFASMGSALCFPVEAMVFFIAIVTARLALNGLPTTPECINIMCKQVYVYGDDIVVPSDEAHAICEFLESIGLKVNRDKSFWSGKFRESCGMDAYDGQSVTPVYCRYPVPNDRTDASALTSYVAFANGLHSRGLWQSAAYVRVIVENILGKLPASNGPMEGLHWTTFSKLTSVSRWNKHLHCFEVKMWIPTSVDRKDPIDGHAALMKCLTRLETKTRRLLQAKEAYEVAFGVVSKLLDTVDVYEQLAKEYVPPTAPYEMRPYKRNYIRYDYEDHQSYLMAADTVIGTVGSHEYDRKSSLVRSFMRENLELWLSPVEAEQEHLARSARRHVLRLKHGWSRVA